MLIIGLTGGVASGKNFIASHFNRLKIPVFDADFEVHKLLVNDQEIISKINSNFPSSIIDNKVNRKKLAEEVLADQNKLQILEKIIYPKLRQKENQFIKNCRRNHTKIAVLNIPLLFEKNGDKRCDKTIAVLVPRLVQLQRFKNRFSDQNDFSEKKFQQIIGQQTSNLRRKKRADFIIYNGLNKAFSLMQFKQIVKKLIVI